MECPACKSKNVRRSLRRGLKEGLFLRLIFRAPYRCFQCGSRFNGNSYDSRFRARKKHRSLWAFLGFRGAEKNKIKRMSTTLFVGMIFIILAIYLVLRMTESSGPAPHPMP
jgi:hypothetical protein